MSARNRRATALKAPHEIDPAVFTYYPKLRRVRDHLERNMEKSMSLETAARVAGVERKYFSTLFRNITGVKYREWVAYTRVQRAATMLADNDWPIARLAYNVGFRDLRTFERAFKKHLGTTPLKFKRSVRPQST